MNPEMWDAICHEVARFRELAYQPYRNLAGLADDDLTKERYRGRRYLAPDYLAPLLAAAAGRIQQAFPNADRSEIQTGFAAGAYGPPRIGQPPDVLALTEIAAWSNAPAQLGLERMVKSGASLKAPLNGKSDWRHRWPFAFETLMHVMHTVYYGKDNSQTRRQKNGDIWHNTYSVFERFGNASGSSLNDDADAYSAIIRGSLVMGCKCHELWEDMRLESPEKGLEHCQRHNLEAWSGEEPLNGFVWASRTCVRHPRPRVIQPQCNDQQEFRPLRRKDLRRNMSNMG